MNKKNRILLIFCIFAIGIVGFGHPMTRELSTSPFPITKVDVIKKLNNMPKRLTTERFIRKACKVHGDKYDYSKVDYVDAYTKVCITCNKHGFFWQSPNSHLNGRGCPMCGKEKADNKKGIKQSVVVDRMIATHGNFYDYSQFVYVDMHTKGIIVCPIHGKFLQSAHEHISGQGCPICSGKKKWTEEMFLDMARKKFGNKFVYYHDFIDSETVIKITCSIHGDFFLTPRNHLRSAFGCPHCAHHHMATQQTYSWDIFVKKAISKWGNTYDYSMINETNYINTKNKIPIICPNHGVFWQKANNHLRGAGCPHCLRSLGEEQVSLFLNKYGIEYKPQYKFNNDILFCSNNYFRVDFFLQNQNIVIEYNGEQHYKDVSIFSERTFIQQQERDMALRQYCKEHKIKLIEIPYWDYENIETILKKELKVK